MSTEYAEGPQTQPAWLDQPDCWGLLAMASIYGIWRPAEYKFYVTAMHPDRISLGIRTGRENYVWGRIPHGLRIGQSELGQFSAWLMAKTFHESDESSLCKQLVDAFDPAPPAWLHNVGCLPILLALTAAKDSHLKRVFFSVHVRPSGTAIKFSVPSDCPSPLCQNGPQLEAEMAWVHDVDVASAVQDLANWWVAVRRRISPSGDWTVCIANAQGTAHVNVSDIDA